MHMESALLDQNEITEFLASYGDIQVRSCEAVLLLPLDKLYALLDIQIRSMWEAMRDIRKGLPTSKTALKNFSKDSAKCSRAVQEKFIRALPMTRRSTELSEAQIESGYSVPTVTHWLGFLALACSNPILLEYWEERLYALSNLSGPVIRSLPKKVDRFSAYASAEVVTMLGCPASRLLLLKLLVELKGDDELESNKALSQLLAADAYAALLRVVAWLMAESQVANWEFEVQEGTHNVIRAAWAIPKWCEATQSWSNPIEVAFEKLASLAGSTRKRPGPVTYLGKIWAASDGVEEASRIRLLRNWVQLKGGRPSFKILFDLVKACCDLHFQGKGGLPSGTEVGYWEGACVFRFAETMSLLIRDMQKGGWPRDVLISMMSVYEAEYRTARRLMGRPIEG